jgi:putative transposase
MPQSLTKNYLHIVFSTKYRQPLIHEPVQNELYNYIGGTCRELECYPVQIGGYTDHMHILCIIQKNHTYAAFEGSKNKLLQMDENQRIFTPELLLAKRLWRLFSKPRSNRCGKNLHTKSKSSPQKKTFQDEYRYFLNKYNIEYDERYVWD